jgi:hypothetical protein
MTRTATDTNFTTPKTSQPSGQSVAPRAAKAKRRISVKQPELDARTTVSAHPVTKRDQLAAMLVCDEGATLDQMIAATGWLPHTTRAALTGLRKAGYAIDSDKIDGVRTYRAVAPK